MRLAPRRPQATAQDGHSLILALVGALVSPPPPPLRARPTRRTLPSHAFTSTNLTTARTANLWQRPCSGRAYCDLAPSRTNGETFNGLDGPLASTSGEPAPSKGCVIQANQSTYSPPYRADPSDLDLSSKSHPLPPRRAPRPPLLIPHFLPVRPHIPLSIHSRRLSVSSHPSSANPFVPTDRKSVV